MGELLGALGVSLYRNRRMYHGCCPVHAGNNPSALNLYPDGDTAPGYWKCQTKGCERTFRRTVLGFVRGTLSNQKFDWQPPMPGQAPRPTVSWREAIDWCCAFLGTTIGAIEVNHGELEKRRFAGDVAALTRAPRPVVDGLNRDVVRAHLKVPADYFVARGWSAEVLDRYDVGLYPGRTGADGRPHPMADRVAVPVYDRDYRIVVGFSARSVFEKCPHCGRHHRPGEHCPSRDDRTAWGRTAKWYNHKFEKESSLYNLWFAHKAIRELGTVVLVEGPGDVWRLEEAGITTSVAIFGVGMSDEQQVLLEMSGALNVVCLLDSDGAGEGGTAELKRRLGRSFRLHFPGLPAKDLGEMRPGAVKEHLGPLLTRLAERGY
jgi:hypothetical protein